MAFQSNNVEILKNNNNFDKFETYLKKFPKQKLHPIWLD